MSLYMESDPIFSDCDPSCAMDLFEGLPHDLGSIWDCYMGEQNWRLYSRLLTQVSISEAKLSCLFSTLQIDSRRVGSCRAQTMKETPFPSLLYSWLHTPPEVPSPGDMSCSIMCFSSHSCFETLAILSEWKCVLVPNEASDSFRYQGHAHHCEIRLIDSGPSLTWLKANGNLQELRRLKQRRATKIWVSLASTWEVESQTHQLLMILSDAFPCNVAFLGLPDSNQNGPFGKFPAASCL